MERPEAPDEHEVTALGAFTALKEAWPVIGVEVETAISMFLRRYNPTNNSIRFIFGDYVEWVLAAALCRLGVVVIPAGPTQQDFDLQSVIHESRAVWSVKASSTKGSKNVRLKNFLGSGSTFQLHPTVFVDPWLGGLVLVDPGTHPEVLEHIKIERDAAILSAKFVKEHSLRHPECFIQADLPVKGDHGDAVPGLDEFRAIVEDDHLHYPNLRWIFDKGEPQGGVSVVEGIRDLMALRDSGALTDEQFGKALDAHLGS